jgi:putative phosphotransacetylase
MAKILIPIEISARHIHLSQVDLDKLFGPGYKLTVLRELSQPGEFASNSVVDIKAGDRLLQKVRILGPVRKLTQVELSKTDSVFMRLRAPLRLSGNTAGSPGLTIMGPMGSLDIKEGVIVAKRHLHTSKELATQHGLKDGQIVSIKIMGDRETIFNNVIVRVNENFKWHFHIDTDEANAAGVSSDNFQGEVII